MEEKNPEPTSLYAELLDASVDGVLAFDQECRYTAWNRAMERISGLTRAQVLGRVAFEVFPFLKETGEDWFFQEALAGRSAVSHARPYSIPESGRRGYFDGHYAPIFDDEGRVKGGLGIVRDVTERKRAEEEVAREGAESRRARAELETVVNTMADGLLVSDAAGNLLFMNPAALKLHGYETPTEVRRRLAHFEEVFEAEDAAGRAVPPADWPLSRVLRGESFRGYELHFKRRDTGLSFHGSYGGAPVTDAAGGVALAVITVTDLSKRKRREEGQRFLAEAGRLISSSLDYETTLAAVARMAVPLLADWCAVDLIGEGGALARLAVAHVDEAKVELAREMHERYPPDPTEPHGIYNVLRTGRPELYPHVTDEMLAAGVPDKEHLRLLRRLRLTSVMLVPLAARGRTLGALTFVSAESGRRFGAEDLVLAESLSQQAAYAIDNARLYAQALGANRLKDEFLATLSHELRTPLTAILGWAQLLGDGSLDAETTRRAVETIRRNAEIQKQLVEDVLDASRIVAGKLRIEPEEVELLGVVREALDAVRPAASARRVEVTCNFDPQVGTIVGDPHRLRQVVWNLLSNAVKFTDPGGRVKVEAGRSLSSVRLTVSDTGQGIAPDFLPYVFERFRQADGSTTRRHGGLGLGLSIVRHMVEAHGGSVHAYSAGLGQGASFTVELPLPTTPAPQSPTGGAVEEQAVEETAPRGDAPPPLLGVRVLLVDDDSDTLELVTLLLKRNGAEVVAVDSAESALEALGRARADVIVSDIGMANVDGYELMRRVRALGPSAGGATPALALTAYASDADRLRAVRAGFRRHLAKPVRPDELVAAVADLAARAGADA